MAEKITKRKQQAINTKKKISKISNELINEKGFENITVDDICSAAGISKGAFYHHFKSKLDIISQVETMANDSIRKVLESEEDLEFKERILIFLSSILSVPEKSGLEITRQRTKYAVGGEYALEDDNDTFAVYSKKILTQFLENAVVKGELKEYTPVGMLVDTLMILISGFISDWCIFNGSYSLTEKSWRLSHFLIPAMFEKYLN